MKAYKNRQWYKLYHDASKILLKMLEVVNGNKKMHKLIKALISIMDKYYMKSQEQIRKADKEAE